jgi:hypothetical protein
MSTNAKMVNQPAKVIAQRFSPRINA